MNIGIINTYHGLSKGPMKLDQMLADICSVNPDTQTKIYQSNIFKAHQIKKDQLDYILTFGGSKTEDNFVEKIHAQNPIPILYLVIPGNTNAQKRAEELTKKGIETYILENVDELMTRVLDIGRYH